MLLAEKERLGVVEEGEARRVVQLIDLVADLSDDWVRCLESCLMFENNRMLLLLLMSLVIFFCLC